MHKMAFLDTNIYLHYQPFDQIDWLQILRADTVTIVIPPVTVRELNRRKDLPSRSRVRKRAGDVLKKLSSLFQSGPQAQLRAGIDLLLEDRDPIINFAEYQLSRQIQDDNLIASTVVCRNEMQEAEIVLVTADEGLTLRAKAKRHAIDTIRLPQNLRLPEEPDPNQKRIQELEQQLRELQLRAPELSLTFEDGRQRATFVLPHPLELTREELVGELKAVKDRYPKMEENAEKLGELPEGMASMAAAEGVRLVYTVSPEETARYNGELDEFYRAYAKYLRETRRFGNLRRRTVAVAIVLANDGTAPAEDIDVSMLFPEGFDLRTEADYPEPPDRPEPPRKPAIPLEQLSETLRGISRLWDPLASYIPEAVVRPPNVSPPRVRRTNGYEVGFHVDRVKHKLQECFDALYVAFDSFGAAQSFHIDYRILAANVPTEMAGRLHVIIRKGQEGDYNH